MSNQEEKKPHTEDVPRPEKRSSAWKKKGGQEDPCAER